MLSGMAPVYLNELLSIRAAGRVLRSTASGVVSLYQPIGKTAYYGNRSFSICAPRLWNNLPTTLRSAKTLSIFKSCLKTDLFRNYFVR